MACLIRAPVGRAYGCLSFTTPERDAVINRDPAARRAVASLKDRFLVGLHHNWHDHAFSYDPLFDFSMAGDGDLIETAGRPFPRVAVDACNFAPPCFAPRAAGEPFWDVLGISRAVNFKGLPAFLEAIRTLFDRGRPLRVLHLCPVPPAAPDGTTLHDIRARFEAMFSTEERQRFTFLTMAFDYPFPLDLDTLAFFYRSSRIYLHAAPEERRCRTAGYAWATGMPVVARENVASILPASLRRAPFWVPYERDGEMADAVLAALEMDRGDAQWRAVEAEFQAEGSALRLRDFLDGLAAARGRAASPAPVGAANLGLRLGRHHGLSSGSNRVPQDLDRFCAAVGALPDAALARLVQMPDPELALAAGHDGRAA